MTRQQRRQQDRELNKVSKAMAAIIHKKHVTSVDENQFQFLEKKAQRLREKIGENTD